MSVPKSLKYARPLQFFMIFAFKNLVARTYRWEILNQLVCSSAVYFAKAQSISETGLSFEHLKTKQPPPQC